MSTLAPPRPTIAELEAIVRDLIRGPISDDILVLGAGYAGDDEAPEEGTPFVDLACMTKLACYHAMISIADHATNDLSDWREGWTSDGQHPYVLRIWNPQRHQR